MKKFGGGVTLAKVHNAENMREKEVNQIGEVVPKFIEKNIPTLWDATPGGKQHGRLKAKLVIKRLDPVNPSSRLSSIAPQLFNLEPHSKPEKSLGVKLGLYQMESF